AIVHQHSPLSATGLCRTSLPVCPGARGARSMTLHQCVSGARSAFLNLLADPRAAQRKQLRHILQSNATTEFGRRHAFASLRNESEYRAAVPIQSYDDLRHSIDRVANGEPSIL